jgi:HK97 family phage major capsid protein
MASLDELRARRSDAKDEVVKLDAEYAGEYLDPNTEDGTRYTDLNAEIDELDKTIAQIERRQARVETISQQESNTETIGQPDRVNRNRFKNRVPDDPSDLDEYRKRAHNVDDYEMALTDVAKTIIDRHFRPKNPHADLERSQDFISNLLDTVDHARVEEGTRSLARRIIATSSRGYSKEFGNFMKSGGKIVGPEMERALTIVTTGGGYAVPVELDTTLILASAGVTNPFRQISRVRTTTGNVVNFINTTGVVAAYANEATNASDNAPSLNQPVVNVEKAQAFIPGSIEAFQDWANIQSDMAMAFADAKNTLENTKFALGLGHASHEPQGLIAAGGATAVVTTAATATIAVADLYSLQQGLSERWQNTATFIGSRAFFNKVRQLDTAGGANLWVQLPDGNPPILLGRPAYIASAYSSGITTSGSTVATFGDFSNLVIVDRVGLSVEFIPLLTTSAVPTGQRGLYMYWRNSTQVLTPSLQANSAFVSLKVL